VRFCTNAIDFGRYLVAYEAPWRSGSVQHHDQTPSSETAMRLHEYLRNRLQVLSNHLSTEQAAFEKHVSWRHEATVSWHLTRDHAPSANDGSRVQPRVLVLQTELHPDLALIASIARVGVDIVGPLCELSQAWKWIEKTERFDAAILDITLQDGIAFDLASELLRRKIPFLFYTPVNQAELIPTELREMPFLEKPVHFVLVAKLLSKMITDG
jgi:hypothetical protein